MAYIQSAIGTMSSDTDVSASATGSAVASGNLVLGGVIWYDPYHYGASLSVSDDKSNNYPLIATINDGGDSSIAVFGLTNITNGPSTITAGFSDSVAYIQVIWSEYSGLTQLVGNSGLSQLRPGTTADAITSSSFTPTVLPALIWGVVGNENHLTTFSAGTSFTIRAADPTPGNWSLTCEDSTVVAGPTAATFTDATYGATDHYITVGVAAAGPPAPIVRKGHLLRVKRQRVIRSKKRKVLPFPIIQPARVIPSFRLQARKHWLRPRTRRPRPRPLQVRPVVYPFPRVVRPATYNQGIAFRATKGFVSDVTFFDFNAGGMYPQVTSQGNVVGFTTTYPTVVAQNERATQDARLAGNLYNNF